MPNEQKKQDGEDIRNLKLRLDSLTKAIDDNSEIQQVIPEAGLIQKYQENNNTEIALLEEEEFSNLTEQVAALQFNGKRQEEICTLLNIEPREFKAVVLSEQFQEVKKRLAEDQKTYILSKSLAKVDQAFNKLGDLIKCADEDKTSLNAIALVLEQAHRLLEDQRGNSPSTLFGGAIKEANKQGDEVSVLLAHIIMKKRQERGLKD